MFVMEIRSVYDHFCTRSRICLSICLSSDFNAFGLIIIMHFYADKHGKVNWVKSGDLHAADDRNAQLSKKKVIMVAK